MTPEEFDSKIKPHIDLLFTGKYDLVITPNDEKDHPINYSVILRTLVNAVNNLLNDPNKKRKIE